MIAAKENTTMSPHSSFRSRLGLGLFLAACAVPSIASASDADALFREGRALLDAKRYDEACPKLAESQKLEPGAGTLLALALCHEGQGKTATASAELKQASELGRKNGRADLANAADKRAAALEASVPHLVVKLADSAEKDQASSSAYRVRLDGRAMQASELGAPLAVDPGEHRLEVAADGKMTRSYAVKLAGAGSVEISVDKLDDMPAPSPGVAPPVRAPIVVVSPPATKPAIAAEPAAEDKNRGSGQRTLGLVIAGAGIVGIGAGAYFGGRALSESSEANRACPTAASCPNGENDAKERSKDSFRVSVVSLASGTGALTLGAIIYFLAPSADASPARGDGKPPSKTARIIPAVGPDLAGLTAVGTF